MISLLERKRKYSRHNFVLAEFFVASALLAACLFVLNNGGFSFDFSEPENGVTENQKHFHTAAKTSKNIESPKVLPSSNSTMAENDNLGHDEVIVDDDEISQDEMASVDESFMHHTHQIGCYFFCRNQRKSLLN